MVLFEKLGQHQPLNRQAERYAKEGVCSACRPWPTSLVLAAPCSNRSSCLEAHVFAAERLHGDDTTVPVLAKGQDADRAMLGLCA
jgi:hypothetical protein